MGGLARPGALRRRTPLRFSLSVMGRTVEVATEAPPERARLDELLPALRDLEDAVVAAAVDAAAAAGGPVSCARGCAACCKQHPVSVTPPEAVALARLVDRLPEPRRSAVRAAFASAVERLKTAGLYDAFLERDPVTGESGEDDRLVRGWMALRLHCPFLVEEACGIYDERPFICRQYLVTSAPELCDDPVASPVRRLPLPIGMLTAVLETTQSATAAPEHAVPLILALDFAARRRGELGRKHDARAVLGDVLGRL